MQKKSRLKLFCKILTVLAVVECLYLFVLPPIAEQVLNRNSVRDFINSKSNADINYAQLKLKTYIIPAVSVYSDFVKITDGEEEVAYADNLQAKIALLPLLFKKLNLVNFSASSVNLNLHRYEDGSFNLEKLFKTNNKKVLKSDLKNLQINIGSYNVNATDFKVENKLVLSGQPLVVKFNKKGTSLRVITKGNLLNGGEKSDFDIDLQTGTDIKNLEKNAIDGSCLIYNLKLKNLLPFIQKYVDMRVSQMNGVVDFLQISTSKAENGLNQITVNSQFTDVVFDKTNWKNHIEANGKHQINVTAEIGNKLINVETLGYKADKIDIKAQGSINLKDKLPELDISADVKNSRAENIAAILPPTLVPQYMTIEKIKTYGVFGDLEASVQVKGKCPKPDITGYVNGTNVHILDKSLHKLHKGTVKITFDKRILNMDILIDLFDNQKARVNGYVYMFRDGLNNVNVKTTDNIDFPLAQKLVVPVSKVFNFQLGPIPDMDIKTGKGVIDINIQGSVDIVKIYGYSSFRNAKLTYNGLFGEVHDGKGRLDFKDDIIKFKSEKAFVKNNPLEVSGSVKINDKLDFNISSEKADSVDVLEIINRSELLKDVKAGLGVLTGASGAIKLFVNMKANIVPVPYGMPPLPPEEAFTDMKVNGYTKLADNSCTIEGFKTPIKNVHGTVNFTEETVDLTDIKGVVGTSPIVISGKVLTDIKTKIPDVDITVTGKTINLKDTIVFLSESYLYPENYPDISALYNVDSKHDLYFKYKAKSVDFITDKAYAVMNFIDDKKESKLKAVSGRVVLDKSTVKVENVKTVLLDSSLNVNGHIDRVDTVNPIYNLKVVSDKFDFANLNNLHELSLIPAGFLKPLSEFGDYQGFAKINMSVNKNVLSGCVDFAGASFKNLKTGLPFNFDDFSIKLKDNKVHVENMTAIVGGMPVYADVTVSDVFKKPYVDGYFTSKVTEEFLHQYLFPDDVDKIKVAGDINFSLKAIGHQDDLNIFPKLTLNPYADLMVENTSLGEITDKREFKGEINLKKDKINIKNIDYIKYISSQNNRVYPIKFASANAILKIGADNVIEPEEINLKTERNISARVLNLLLKKPVFRQGALNCDLKYKLDKITKTAKLLGKMDCRNLDIPLFDTVIKNIKVDANEDGIGIRMIGFISDSRISISSEFANSINARPEIYSLDIKAEEIDNDSLFRMMSKTHTAMNKNNQLKHFDLNGLKVNNGSLNIKKLTIKSMKASDFNCDFSIDEKGIFKANNLSVGVGNGNISGDISYNLSTTDMEGDFTLANVDANYIGETLFEMTNQIYGSSNGKIVLQTKGTTDEEIIKNLSGFVFFDINDGRMPKLGSLEYLLRAGNIIKSGITGFTINNILELLNLVKSGYFSNINGNCIIENGVAKNIEIYSKGDNMSMYIHGIYDINAAHAELEILGKISKQISTIFGAIGNTSINTFFKLIPGVSMLDFGRKNFVEDVEKIPPFTGGYYDARTFQAIINGNINESGYVQSFKWVQ